MSSSSLINPVVGHLAELALWEAELAVDPVGLTRCLWRRRWSTGCGRYLTRAGCGVFCTCCWRLWPDRVRDVRCGDAPIPVVVATDGEPVEREQRRAATRAVTHPAPAGLLPAVAVDGKRLHEPAPRPGRCSSSPRSPTTRGHPGPTAGWRTNAARARSSPTC